jgi:putative ABC transport system permease protein
MIGLLRENVKIALGSIRTQLLRTVLTVIIIAIGITALVGILTVVTAIEYNLNSSFASMGSNTFNINQYEFRNRRSGGEVQKINPIITYTEAKTFKEKYDYPLTQTSLSFVATSAAEVKFENQKTDPEISVLGIDEYYLSNSGIEITQGRSFNTFDISNNVYACIVGSDFISDDGLLREVNPIDKILTIRGAKFRVIGVLKEQGSTFGNSQDLRIMIPIQVARSMFSAPSINYSLSMMTVKKEFLDEAVDDAIITMRKVRRLNPVEDNNFAISRSDDLLNRIADLTGYLNLSAWVIGIITILGSSIALMNIMIVSVTERTREIGVRKSLGATKRTIAMQFFIETLTIGQIGGIFGIIFGILVGFLICLSAGWDFVIPWGAIMAAFATSFVVALVSGLYPAIKASQLDPIEALRYE